MNRRPATNRGAQPPCLQLARDLRAGAVDDDDLVAGRVPLEHEPAGVRGDAAAELHDDAGHVVYSAFSFT